MPKTTATPNRGYGPWTPFWFLAPSVVTLLLIGIYPLLFALVTSFRRYNLTRPREGFPFVGFDNYAAVLTDSTFWASLFLTAKFYITVLPIQIVLGMGIALLLHKPGLGLLKSLARVTLVVPLATTYAVVGLIGRLVFNRDFGVANQALDLFGIGAFDWLGSPAGAFASPAMTRLSSLPTICCGPSRPCASVWATCISSMAAT